MKAESPSIGDKFRSGAAGLETAALTRRHLSFGWWALLLFLTFGLLLESLHGFKVGWYLDVTNKTRRLMWTLAHAHGTLLGLVNIAFGATVHLLPGWEQRSRNLASYCLMAATVLVPGGFFLGGAAFYGGDPGFGILLLPAGALFLCLGVFLCARGVRTLKVPAGRFPAEAPRKSTETKPK